MDFNLLTAAKLFTPPIKHRRKNKKKTDNRDPGKMSMKKRTPGQLTQQTRTTPSALHPFLSSDESDTDVLPISQPPLFSGNVNDWITDDESETHKPKSTATSKTSASYKTCLTNLTFKVELSEDESDEATPVVKRTTQKITYEISDDESVKEVIQETPSATPATPKLHEVSSCEKVTRWLHGNPSPKESPKVLETARRLKMTSSDEPPTLSQATSSGYPSTFATNPSRFSSQGATSRQGSRTESPLLPLSQNSQPTSDVVSNQRNSLLNSQTSSSRSSSFYFKDRAPWSTSQPEKKKKTVRRKPCPPKYSDVTDWSDAKSHLESQETEESLRLFIEASENEENLFAHNAQLLANNEEMKIPSRRRSSKTTSSESYAKTWEKMSEIFASSEEFNANPNPLHDLTNFNPVLSSTQRDSVFQFPSYSEQGREALDNTLSPKAASNNIPITHSMGQLCIEISSGDDSDCPPEKSAPVKNSDSSSDDNKVTSEVTTRRRLNTRASYIELVISETEDEDDSQQRPTECHRISDTEDEDDSQQRPTECQRISETEEEEEINDMDKLQAKRCSIQDVRKLTSSKLDTSHHLKEAATARGKTPPQCSATTTYRKSRIDSSDDDEDALELFFQKQRELRKKVPVETPKKSVGKDDSFIVDDDVIEVNSDEDDDEKDFSPSFYLKVINDRRRAENQIDLSIRGGNLNEIRKQFTQFQTPTPTKGSKRIVAKTDPKPQTKPKFISQIDYSPCLSFIASLSSNNYQRCDPEAVPFMKKFKSTKDDLVERLFTLFNKTVFDSKLDSDMSITWNNRLTSTAGFCYNQRKKIAGDETIRISRIELSGKILTNCADLRDTLIHEMCHAATWVIDGTLGGHGPVWKKWTVKAKRVHRDLPEIKRCHSFNVQTKYTYKCTVCLYSFGRHSKSIDLARKVCGVCRGRFELIINTSKGGSASAPQKKPNSFALFVKENYKIERKENMKHQDVMQALSLKFKEAKIQNGLKDN